MKVICPICNAMLRGEGENELSRNLQEHFMTRHGYTDLCDLGNIKGEEACQASEGGDLANLTYAERRLEEAGRPGGPIHPGEDVMESVRCPLCGKTLYGHAFDDLSYNLAKHLDYEHNIKTSAMG